MATRDADFEAYAEEDSPELWLGLALRAGSPAERLRAARRGLSAEGVAAETAVLLLRQMYLAHLDRDDLDAAEKTATEMVSVGALRDVALHDHARVLGALGRFREAVEAQRLATRACPAERRSFMRWSLATLQHFAGDQAGALRTLDKAAEATQRDRALLEAHAAWIRTEAGEAVPELQQILDALARSKSARGYGQFILGMLAFTLGDGTRAVPYLEAFLRRHRGADPAKRLTLAEELRRAHEALGQLRRADA